MMNPYEDISLLSELAPVAVFILGVLLLLVCITGVEVKVEDFDEDKHGF